jgi:hypothetical protein
MPPFTDLQPVQGFSSVLRESNGDFLVMSDNGFGAEENSADYLLRVKSGAVMAHGKPRHNSL